MMILAIDTSTDLTSIALVDSEVRAEQTWMSGQNHTRQLLAEVQHLMALEGLDIDDLQGVAVALGPGSFNGLRVGLSAAKGLCYACQIPLAGVGTLEALAYQYADLSMPIRPITNAGRGEFNTALYQMRDGEWTELEEPALASVQQIREHIQGPVLICGDVGKEPIVQLARDPGQQIALPGTAAAPRRAAYLAELGGRKLETGKADDLASLQPIYLRAPAITKSRRLNALAHHEDEENR